MSLVSDFQAYLHLAERFLHDNQAEESLPDALAQIPTLNETLLDQLAQHAEELSLTEPRRGWAILRIAHEAAHSSELFIRCKAAWYLGRACNHLGKPDLAQAALTPARIDFEHLEKTNWVAACDWQLNALTWTKPDYQQTIQELTTALDELKNEFEDFVPHCRMALAYAQILVRDFEAARLNIEACEASFVAKGDLINQARCWLHDASRLRRSDKFAAAFQKLDAALKLFESTSAPIDAAKTHYQMALWYLVSATDYQIPKEHFHKASTVFLKHDMDLWYAFCQNGMGQIDLQNGNLVSADQELSTARKIFAHYNLRAALADNYNDSGQLEHMRGNLPKSLEYLEDAEKIYQSIGAEYSVAITRSNHGNTSALLGRFQEALNDLERAGEKFEQLGNLSGLADCGFFLARIWTTLNRYITAHEQLDQSERLIRQVQKQASLGQIYNQRAIIFALEGKPEDAISTLKTALNISSEYRTEPQTAISERHLGELISRTGQANEALALLISAETRFQQMGMVIEQADTFTSLGYHYMQIAQTQDAKTAFRNALEICQGIMPDIESRSYAGMALLAETHQGFQEALDYYREAITCIVKLRQSFWQPALAGSYLLTAGSVIDSAIQLAARLNSHHDALIFIESSKAQALVKQIASSIVALTSHTPAKVSELWAEIQALQMQLRTANQPGSWLRSSEQLKDVRKKLTEYAQRYDQQLAELEREAGQGISLQHPEFNHVKFIEMAALHFKQPWAALDYYITDTTLSAILVTSDGPQVWQTPINARQRMALDVCAKNHRGTSALSLGDMKALGELLLPPDVQKYLSPDGYLMIAPHRDLHRVPWAALQPKWTNRTLVEECIPVITPSLQVLQLLWQRYTPAPSPTRGIGLLLGVSDFRSGRPALPLIPAEIKSIAQQADVNSTTLLDQEATWDNLIALTSTNGLSDFSFFHIASHASHDPHTGRLSSIALYDREIWLDQLRNLAPLPKLVSLSACNGTQSLIYAGDEHVGLATTCLIAGADTITGSLWPILDATAIAMMTAFYEEFLTGAAPSNALANAQRAAIQNGEPLQNWASFLCLGMP